MHRFYLPFLFFSRFVDGFYLPAESEDYTVEQEPCSTRCQNGGQCFLSSFCICPKGFSGRYCEISLDEQCGIFPSMTTMEVDCVLCVCYNGLFMCDTQPRGLCRRTSNILSSRSLRIAHALRVLQYRFQHIQSFEPMTRHNVTFDDGTQSIDLHGYRIIVNHSSLRSTSFFLIVFCLFCIYLNNSL